MQGGGAAWKSGCFSQAPWYVSAVMANGFRTPAGVLAVAGLMGLPLWLWYGWALDVLAGQSPATSRDVRLVPSVSRLRAACMQGATVPAGELVCSGVVWGCLAGRAACGRKRGGVGARQAHAGAAAGGRGCSCTKTALTCMVPLCWNVDNTLPLGIPIPGHKQQIMLCACVLTGSWAAWSLAQASLLTYPK